ncbi:MAG TPA: hypothetical protein VKU82_00395, partial [Planctomycetaceae bacterium]|nr:hypothetical protein [Planctomycetaceae bacterium]
DAQPGEQMGLELVLAELREIQGRRDETVAIYRKLIDGNDRNVLALNNLAWFLSYDPAQRGASLELINRAIRVQGPDPELLDTRAVVRMNLDHPQEAVQDLEQALKEVNSPAMWYHLALAQNRVGEKDAAAESLRLAEEAGFDPTALHPLEKSDYEKLLNSLPQSKKRAGL